jgi:hypothetical protein
MVIYSSSSSIFNVCVGGHTASLDEEFNWAARGLTPLTSNQANSTQLMSSSFLHALSLVSSVQKGYPSLGKYFYPLVSTEVGVELVTLRS